MSYVRPVDMDTVLNYMYKTLKKGSERKLENFNGKRKISVYRGDHYLNKITRKLSDPPYTLIRYMQNTGTSDKPIMKTATIAFKAPHGDILVYFKEPGNSMKGVLLNVFREGFNPYKKNFPNLMEVRKDDYFRLLLYRLTGKDIAPDGIHKVIERLDKQYDAQKLHKK